MFLRSTYISIIAILLCTLLFVVACSPINKSIKLNTYTAQVWPSKPDKPRIGYVASFNHPDHLGIEKGFFTKLGELFTGEKERNMVRPMAITQTSDETLFVADPGVKGVHRFDINKKRYSLIRLADDNVLPSPVGLAADKDNNVYVVDSELGGLFKIHKNNDIALPVSLDTDLIQPTAIAIDAETNSFYITDTGSHQIKHFSFDGKLTSIIGRRGKAEGEFNFPTMIWLDNAGKLYVTDSLNFRIQVFNKHGKFIKYFGKQGDSTGNLSRSKGVATDRKGHIYVVDALFHVFQLFDKNGKFLLHVGGQGQAQGEFWLPSGIFINDNNVIYIADSHNKRVQVFRYVGDKI